MLNNHMTGTMKASPGGFFFMALGEFLGKINLLS